MTRRFWLLTHRYAGLAMTHFLIIVGLTGSMLAFYHEHGWGEERTPTFAATGAGVWGHFFTL